MSDITSRKSEHLQIVTEGRGAQNRRDTGFDGVQFRHNALPDLDFDAIDMGTHLLGRRLRAPLLVS
ncbi:MAG: type 2 isopentenyl-diphosphate Delta-isomerase, partial [Paracoccus sp. (in: a-proteobacteria)]